MPINDKQEHFCQIYETNGHNALQAYIKAYPNSSHKSAKANSARLIDNDRIKARLVEIRAEAALKAGISVESQVKETIELRESAKSANQLSVAASLNEQLNKHVGLYKADNEQKQEKTKLDEQQRKDQDEYNAWKRRQLLKQA